MFSQVHYRWKENVVADNFRIAFKNVNQEESLGPLNDSLIVLEIETTITIAKD